MYSDWEDLINSVEFKEVFKDIKVYTSKNNTTYILSEEDMDLLNEKIFKES